MLHKALICLPVQLREVRAVLGTVRLAAQLQRRAEEPQACAAGAGVVYAGRQWWERSHQKSYQPLSLQQLCVRAGVEAVLRGRRWCGRSIASGCNFCTTTSWPAKSIWS
jgi:hypothetical protein